MAFDACLETGVYYARNLNEHRDSYSRRERRLVPRKKGATPKEEPPSKVSPIPRQKVRRDLGKIIARRSIENDLDQIDRVRTHGDRKDWPLNVVPRIHRMVLNGNYKYLDVTGALGSLHDLSDTLDSRRDPVYRCKYAKQKGGLLFTIYTSPKIFRPPCKIEIYPREGLSVHGYVTELRRLADHLPLLKVSQCEYATDIFCKKPNQVERVFWALARHIHFPRAHKASRKGKTSHDDKIYSFGAVFESWEQQDRENIVYRMNNNKVYERGKDSDRKKKGTGQPYWLYPELDRVRVEHTAKRRELKLHGLDKIGDFVASPKFAQIMADTNVSFRDFGRTFSNVLPQVWDGYPTKDQKGNYGFFQLELKTRRDEVKNIDQYVGTTRPFTAFKARLQEVWQEFDAQWPL